MDILLRLGEKQTTGRRSMRPVAAKGRGYNEMKKKKIVSCKYKNTQELLTKKPQPVKKILNLSKNR